MSLAASVGFKNSSLFPYLNTNTAFDMATCTYLQGFDGRWYMYGGVGPVTGVVGRSGYYKSTIIDYLASQVLRIYPGSQVFKLDTEQTMNMYDRYENNLADIMTPDEVVERVHITNKSETSFKEFVDLIKNIGKEKQDKKKDYLVETPFLDKFSGKPVKFMIPTIVILDSISELVVTANVDILLSSDMEDKRANTADLIDGRIKKRLMSALTVWAREYGIYFFVSAHVGDKKDLDMYHPEPSQNQWLSSSDKIKSAGNNFFFLPNLLFQCGKPSPLINKEKMPIYPLNEDSNVHDKIDLNSLPVKILRNKSNITGGVIPFVCSQSTGINSSLTYYDYLTKNNVLNKVGHNYTSCLFPNDLKLNRKNIRRECESNYRLNRALELIFQLSWLNDYWNLSRLSVDVPKTAELLLEGINRSKSIAIDDILESRGYWTYDDKCERPYLSLMDVCSMVVCPEEITVQVPDTVK